MKKLYWSNKAHDRLSKKHGYAAKKLNGKGPKYHEHFVKKNYHSSVVHRQNKLGRVLTRPEREKVYHAVIFDFY